MSIMPNAVRPPGLRLWGEYLLAILGGNIAYYWLYPRLPAALQHQTFRIDWGLGLDFVICAGMYGLLRLFRPARQD
jgi:hypothetical protein